MYLEALSKHEGTLVLQLYSSSPIMLPSLTFGFVRSLCLCARRFVKREALASSLWWTFCPSSRLCASAQACVLRTLNYVLSWIFPVLHPPNHLPTAKHLNEQLLYSSKSKHTILWNMLSLEMGMFQRHLSFIEICLPWCFLWSVSLCWWQCVMWGMEVLCVCPYWTN